MQHVEAVLERVETGLDYELASGGVLEIEFDDGSKMVVNAHLAAREIWVAARSGGFHYRWDGQQWVDTRSGEELLSTLGKLMQAQGGVTVNF